MTDPIARVAQLLGQAERAGVVEPNAMALATADADGRPSVRMVLLKGVDPDGFAFYTNLESRKAGELVRNPRAALCIHWKPLEVQIRVEGDVVRVSDSEADAYFATRPRGSQIGAWSSMQSRPLSSFAELERRVAEVEERFAGGPVTRPPFWSGFRLIPSTIEFWSGRPSRLHEREVFTRESPESPWRSIHLYP